MQPRLNLDGLRCNLDSICVHFKCNVDAVKISVEIGSTDKVKSYFFGRVGWVASN